MNMKKWNKEREFDVLLNQRKGERRYRKRGRDEPINIQIGRTKMSIKRVKDKIEGNDNEEHRQI